MRKIIAALQVSVDGFIEGQRHALKLVRAKLRKSGKIALTYRTHN
jgi:hypothetical protein